MERTQVTLWKCCCRTVIILPYTGLNPVIYMTQDNIWNCVIRKEVGRGGGAACAVIYTCEDLTMKSEVFSKINKYIYKEKVRARQL